MRGGLADHTDRLAQSLSNAFRVTVLTAKGVETDRPFTVNAAVSDWHDRKGLVDRVRAAAGEAAILWQYVPHMYGRGGVNFAVPGAMAQFALEGRRQFVLAHEIRAPFSWWPNRSGYALAHRIMWRRLRATVTAIGISTEVWLKRESQSGLGGAARDHGVLRDASWPSFFLAPSPSNVPVVPVEAGHRWAWRAAHGLEGAAHVMGFFGSVGTGKQFDWVLEGWREARRRLRATGLVVIGGKPELRLTEEERRWFRPLGYLGSDEVSEAMQAFDLLALPFEDGVSERRSSFMVGLAHGVRAVTTLGEGTGSELRSGDFFVGVPVEAGSRAFAEAIGNGIAGGAMPGEMGERARRRYEARYDWGCLAGEIERRLVASVRG